MRVVIDASVDPRLVAASEIQCAGEAAGVRCIRHGRSRVARNKVAFYRPLFPQLLNAIVTVRAGEVVHVYSLITAWMFPTFRMSRNGLSLSKSETHNRIHLQRPNPVFVMKERRRIAGGRA
jgi:hypothetical protein